ncbi:MAG: hypothetical protein KDI33_08690 [Halioglobus sp.]|nr:hypothetical protein [Halioglobus sp.]
MTDEERGKPEQEREDYAEHLARVLPDADHSRALLQAHYKALHTAPSSRSIRKGRSSRDSEE